MDKVQKVIMDLSSNRHEYQSIFCPFTGGMLQSSDAQEEIDVFPSTVVLVFSESIEYPYFIAPSFNDNSERFMDLEDIDHIIKTLNDIEGHYLIFDVRCYGSHSGDFGQMIFVLRIPNVEVLE